MGCLTLSERLQNKLFLSSVHGNRRHRKVSSKNVFSLEMNLTLATLSYNTTPCYHPSDENKLNLQVFLHFLIEIILQPSLPFWSSVITPAIHLCSLPSPTLLLFVEFQSDTSSLLRTLDLWPKGWFSFCSNNVRNIYFKIQLKFFCFENPLGNSYSLFGTCLLNSFPTSPLVCLSFASSLSFWGLQKQREQYYWWFLLY